jgi:glycosyltransferase involved in cell wall biosynthesis
MNVCTIIAKNYVAHARVLARSLTEQHPDDRLWTLIIDDFERYLDPAQEPFEVLTPADIDCEPFTHMALRYSVLELSTAVKPWLMRHLLAETGGPVTYLDPDIKIYGPLERLDRLAAEHGVVLIPHNRRPIPPDDRKPSQVDIMIAGVYNLGYVTLASRPEVDSLLDWWADRLRRDCRVDPKWGYFVDQRWFDLAPGFLSDLAIVRDPEYNVAYWNLHERRLEHGDGGYLVDSRPLAFFHFSGFDADHPLVLSRYQDRVDVLANPALERILAEYGAEVNGAGHAKSRKWPYNYGALGDGTRLDDTLREMYDEFVDEHPGHVPSPFTLDGVRVFQNWLGEQAPGAAPGINRMLAHLYRTRPDLRGMYPDVAGPGGAELLRWAREYGRQEIPLLARLMTDTNGSQHSPVPPPPKAQPPAVAPGGAPAPDRPQDATPPVDLPPAPAARPGAGPVPGTDPVTPLSQAAFGVNVVGYFRSELGTGEAARQVVAALDSQHVPVMPIHGQTIPLSRQGHAYTTAAPEDAAYPVNLICMNADMLPEFAGQAGEEFFAGRYSIGLWFWEIARFPERWRSSFSLVDEVWAPTAHIAAALEPLATVPVTTVRIPVQFGALEPRSRADLGLPEDKFLFLVSFDYLSVFKRKNPLAAVEAFRRAFAPGEGAGLVVKCINHERDPDSHAQLRAAVSGHPDIEVIDRYMSPQDNSSLTALCDCYVSLHRAEGFGLIPAEAMWLGKPVIATAYSGNLDFMTPSNSLLVDYRLVAIGSGADPYPADAEWAEPDAQQASRFMRGLFDDPERARALGAAAAADIRRTHSPEAAGEIMHRRLEAIRATGRPRPSIDRARRRPALSILPIRIRQGPVAHARPGRAHAVRELARNTILRLMRPYTTYQQSIDELVVDALDDLGADIARRQRESAGKRAELMADLRSHEELSRLLERQAQTIEALERRLEALERERDRVSGAGSSTPGAEA